MSKDFEALFGGCYFLGGMAFIVWFMLTESPASDLLVALSRRPLGRAFVFPVALFLWMVWPIALVGLGLWSLKKRGRADA
jgi:hypothetical protein